MADIKTRDVVKGSIKTIDKAAIASERMKHAYISTKEKAEHSTHASQNSVDEYASDKFESAVDTTVHEGIYQFDKAGRKGVQNTRENYYKAKDSIQNFKEKRASQSLERQSVNRHGKGRIKTVEQTQKTVKEIGRAHV